MASHMTSHIWLQYMPHSHLQGAKESCHTREGQSCHTDEGWFMPHIWMSHITHINEACHTYECGMSHIWMRHISYKNEPCHTPRHTYAGVLSHMDVKGATYSSVKWECVLSHVVTNTRDWCHIWVPWVPHTHLWSERVSYHTSSRTHESDVTYGYHGCHILICEVQVSHVVQVRDSHSSPINRTHLQSESVLYHTCVRETCHICDMSHMWHVTYAEGNHIYKAGMSHIWRTHPNVRKCAISHIQITHPKVSHLDIGRLRLVGSSKL